MLPAPGVWDADDSNCFLVVLPLIALPAQAVNNGNSLFFPHKPQKHSKQSETMATFPFFPHVSNFFSFSF
jgi:hypothetical protein